MVGAVITFRRVRRGDFALLRRWLTESHVARWWNHETTPEAIERDFGPSADGDEPSEDHLVLLDGDPVGLIQFSRFVDYPEYRDELAAIVDVPEGAVTIDYLLGEPGLVGHGLGTAMLAGFTERIWAEEPEATCVVVPVCSANEASWRALTRAGYDRVARGRLEPDNPTDDGWHEIVRSDRPVS